MAVLVLPGFGRKFGRGLHLFTLVRAKFHNVPFITRKDVSTNFQNTKFVFIYT